MPHFWGTVTVGDCCTNQTHSPVSLTGTVPTNYMHVIYIIFFSFFSFFFFFFFHKAAKIVLLMILSLLRRLRRFGSLLQYLVSVGDGMGGGGAVGAGGGEDIYPIIRRS